MNTSATQADTTPPSSKVSMPVWFWVISITALLWYLMDTSAFYMRVFMVDKVVKSMPENQQHLYLTMPLWVNIVFAIEALGGLLGSISLLLKEKTALSLFCASIVGVLSQTYHVYFISDAVSVMGTSAVVMPLVAIAIGCIMIAVTQRAISKKWIH